MVAGVSSFTFLMIELPVTKVGFITCVNEEAVENVNICMVHCGLLIYGCSYFRQSPRQPFPSCFAASSGPAVLNYSAFSIGGSLLALDVAYRVDYRLLCLQVL